MKKPLERAVLDLIFFSLVSRQNDLKFIKLIQPQWGYYSLPWSFLIKNIFVQTLYWTFTLFWTPDSKIYMVAFGAFGTTYWNGKQSMAHNYFYFNSGVIVSAFGFLNIKWSNKHTSPPIFNSTKHSVGCGIKPCWLTQSSQVLKGFRLSLEGLGWMFYCFPIQAVTDRR